MPSWGNPIFVVASGVVYGLGWLYCAFGLKVVGFESSMWVSSNSSINSNVELLNYLGGVSSVFSFG